VASKTEVATVKNKWMSFLVPALAVLVSLLIAAIIILFIGQNPIKAYVVMIKRRIWKPYCLG
jgi:ABC-type uncharacterized transport system permease subunit